MSVTATDVQQFREHGAWRTLAGVACSMIVDAEAKAAGTRMKPQLGGGTRLMLAIGHRISDDIDLFIRDPQWIGYLTPRLNDRFEAVIKGYDESSTSLNLRLDEGEIDFIVGMSLLGLGSEHHAAVPFELEPVEEVIAKKLFYRGWALTPRHLYDWRAVATRPEFLHLGGLMRNLLDDDKRQAIRDALSAMSRARSARSTWDTLRAPDRPGLGAAIEWGLDEVDRLSALPISGKP
jgi:hypothetical protein